ncbi:MAG: hypothetical protein WDL87_01505 [Candidatus Omnitrophota bacterium]|jgi:hypothetical protein
MGSRGKTSVIILIVLILISLGLAGGTFYLLQNERNEKVRVQQQLEAVKAKELEVLENLKAAKKEIATLENRLQEARLQSEKITLSLEQEKSARKDALSQIDQMYAQLEEQKKSKAYLEKMFYETSDELSKMQAQSKDIESKRLALEKKVKELEDQAHKIELGKIVVSPEGAVGGATAGKTGAEVPKKDASAKLEGKVLVINKDYNFVVTNLGKKEGIDIGDVFSVYHGPDYIGDVKIEKIHDSMSAAGFVSTETKDKVSEGDKVIQKAK